MQFTKRPLNTDKVQVVCPAVADAYLFSMYHKAASAPDIQVPLNNQLVIYNEMT